jgi:hypothetical protein
LFFSTFRILLEKHSAHTEAELNQFCLKGMSEEGEDLMLAQLRASNSLAAWEALDQVLSCPASDVWVQALQQSKQSIY